MCDIYNLIIKLYLMQNTTHETTEKVRPALSQNKDYFEKNVSTARLASFLVNKSVNRRWIVIHERLFWNFGFIWFTISAVSMTA